MIINFSNSIKIFSFLPFSILCMGQWNYRASFNANYRIAKNNIYDYLKPIYTEAKDRPVSGFNCAVSYTVNKYRIPIRAGIGVTNWGVSSVRASEKTGSNVWVYEDWKLKRRFFSNNYLAQINLGTGFYLKGIEIETDLSLNYNFMYVNGLVWRENNDLNKNTYRTLLYKNGLPKAIFPGLETRFYWYNRDNKSYRVKYYSGFQLFFINPDDKRNNAWCYPYSINLLGIDFSVK